MTRRPGGQLADGAKAGSGSVVLLVAFHFPPCGESSGMQRTLRFSQHLPVFGWDPLVLTVHPRAYGRVSSDLLGEVPAGMAVARAFALDSARHLAVRGRYAKWLALPDRWVSWGLGAIPAGLALIRRHRPRVIWSTYPVATAHIVGWALHRLSGLPWVADFRDPMVERDLRTGGWFPSDGAVRRARLWVEGLVARRAARVVFCTEGALRIFRERYPGVAAGRCAVIANGFDEAAFQQAEGKVSGSPGAASDGRVTLLHSGILYYTPDRDPTPFLDALASLRQAGIVDPASLRVIFRASGYESQYSQLIRGRSLEDIVELAPAIPYTDALAEMLSADGLLVFQGRDSNPAIPAKVYEYIRAGRPILGLVDSEGDTARLLREIGTATVVAIDDPARIAAALQGLLEQLRAGRRTVSPTPPVAAFSRQARTAELARLLDAVVDGAASEGMAAEGGVG